MDDPEAKLQVAGHETFPCRYGWLKKSFDAAVQDRDNGDTESVNIFLPDLAIADFGVGKNMVASMRHWSLACGVLEPVGSKKGRMDVLAATRLGEMLFGELDPYLEQPGSLWLLHWRLVSAPGRATTWYYGFNEFNDPVFTKDSLSARLFARLDELRESGRLATGRIARTTVDRDAECFIRTYAVRTGKKGVTEDGLECPFAELGLVTPLVGGALQFRRGAKPSLPDEIFAAGLIEFWQARFAKRGSLSIETVTHEPGSPGRAFGLDEESVAERLERMGDVTAGAIQWDEGAGIRQVSVHKDLGALDPLEVARPALRFLAEAA
ncbi:DUF4007 family protein [Mesorhizobium onobrychidis]|uniref:DUF4007 family protein n=1 Tax=Mesorhizobium onobrychidis TaxID=2775404 RepID=A0ABY5R9R6_9HYPH|nr:DUF4007 family protein [Mesorhizobium onobrychidis]UVC19382.1 DUF4007 family protein [Mesorhizobium onobrychidis]